MEGHGTGAFDVGGRWGGREHGRIGRGAHCHRGVGRRAGLVIQQVGDLALAVELGWILTHREGDGLQGRLINAAIGRATEEELTLAGVVAGGDRAAKRRAVGQGIAGAQTRGDQHPGRTQGASTEADAAARRKALALVDAKAAGEAAEADAAGRSRNAATIAGIGRKATNAAVATEADTGTSRATALVPQAQIQAHRAAHRTAGGKPQTVAGGQKARVGGANGAQGRPADTTIGGHFPVANINSVHGLG